MADSNLTGRYIADSYQFLVQVDNTNSAVGSTNVTPANIVNSDITTLVNGIGQRLGSVTIDQSGVSSNNGGLFLKHTASDQGGLWGIQTSGTGDLNIIREGNNSSHYRLFLRKTGQLFIGFENSVQPPSNQNNYDLYVRQGIWVGNGDVNTTEESSINLVGTNRKYLATTSGNFSKTFRPITFTRFNLEASDQNWGLQAMFKVVAYDEDAQPLYESGTAYVPADQASCAVVGFYFLGPEQEQSHIAAWCEKRDGYWWVCVKFVGDTDDARRTPVLDIMIIDKSLCKDNRGFYTGAGSTFGEVQNSGYYLERGDWVEYTGLGPQPPTL